MGATACGMTGGLLLRGDFKSQTVPDLDDAAARAVCEDLNKEFRTPVNEELLNPDDYIILNTLFPKEINEKVNNYFTKR